MTKRVVVVGAICRTMAIHDLATICDNMVICGWAFTWKYTVAGCDVVGWAVRMSVS